MNDNLLKTLQARFSVGAKFLSEPVPTKEQYLQAVKVALTAPDHRMLKPARFVLIDNQKKLADFFEARAVSAGASIDETTKIRSKALKAPAMVAVIAKIDNDNPRVPACEQWMTAGASACNFLMALELQGFAGKIVSGSSTHYADAVAALCKPGETIAAWIMIGSATEQAVYSQDRPNPEEFFSTFD